MSAINVELKKLEKRLCLEDISEVLYFPKYFEIETIRACNARCGMCTIHEWDNFGKKMSENLFEKIALEMQSYSNWIEGVCLSRNGEPLLDKNLESKIKMLKNYGIKNVTLSTNASLLTEERALSLIDSGLDDIRFSIDGYTKETFESIRRGLNFENVVGNCLYFIKQRNLKGNKPTIQIRMALQGENENEKDFWSSFWIDKVSKQDKVLSKKLNNWGNQLDSFSREEAKVKYAKDPCISPFSTMIVFSDGKIPLCGVDYNAKYLLGDLEDSSIKKIWNSKEYDKVRELHSSGNRNKIPFCIACNIWDLEEKEVYNKNENNHRSF